MMKKVTKRTLIAVGAVVVAAAALLAPWLIRFWGSSCWSGEADVVFVNCSDTPVGSVGLSDSSSSQGGQNADNSPMGRGEYIGFEYDVSYPATVTVYAGLYAGRDGDTPLASCVIETAPEGDRWYVALRDGPSGPVLEAVTEWPLD